MKGSQLFLAAIIIGMIAFVVGILYQTNVLGTYPSRAFIALVAGAIFVVVGLLGLVVMKVIEIQQHIARLSVLIHSFQDRPSIQVSGELNSGDDLDTSPEA